MLTTSLCLEYIYRDGHGLADAAAGNFAASVSKCPGWDVADLVWHIRGVHYFWGTIADERLADPDQVVDLERPADPIRVLDDYRLGVDWLVEVLGKADQSEPVWTSSKQKDIAFITRHQVQEAAVHRWDAEDAAGRQFSIAPKVAADSVDEFLDFSTVSRVEDHPVLDLPVLLVATDTGQEWTVGEDDQGQFWFVRHAEPSAAAAAWRAPASDLLLGLYRRIDPAGTISGNRHLVEHLIARTDLN